MCLSLLVFSQSSTKKNIKKLNKEMEEIFNKNDMLAVSAFYADSAVISGAE